MLLLALLYHQQQSYREKARKELLIWQVYSIRQKDKKKFHFFKIALYNNKKR
jgi:hypothetical protein